MLFGGGAGSLHILAISSEWPLRLQEKQLKWPSS